MKKYGILLATLTLVFSSLACQTVIDGGNGVDETENLPSGDNADDFSTAPPDSSNNFDFSFGSDSEFPMPDDAKNVVSVAGTVNYQTNLDLEEVMDFYRIIFGKQGYSERELLTTVTDGVFSFVFDGHESGQAIVVQGVDLGDGSVNVNISFQDV
ncbi:MAG: hypothetical protein Q8O48_01630 [Anaerolineales bacterium]|nr:hypothetical protein [Anaerolineales bacterium]